MLLSYTKSMTIKPSHIDIEIDKYFYQHHGRSLADWQPFLEQVKQLPSAVEKVRNGQDLTETEQKVYNLYYGPNAPAIEFCNGKLDISDGRHRMQALKELGLSYTRDVNVYIQVEPIRQVNDMYQPARTLFFKKFSNNMYDDISCVAIQASTKAAEKLGQSGIHFLTVQDAIGDTGEYYLIATDNINIPAQFRATLMEFEQNNTTICCSDDKLIEEDFEL